MYNKPNTTIGNLQWHVECHHHTRECTDFEDAKAWGGSAWSGLLHSSGTTKGDNGGETHYNHAELFVYDNAGGCSELFAKGIYNYDQDGRKEANRGGPH